MQTIFFPQVFYDVNWTLNLFFLNTRKKKCWKLLVLEIHLYWKYTTLYLKYQTSSHVLEILLNSGIYACILYLYICSFYKILQEMFKSAKKRIKIFVLILENWRIDLKQKNYIFLSIDWGEGWNFEQYNFGMVGVSNLNINERLNI